VPQLAMLCMVGLTAALRRSTRVSFPPASPMWKTCSGKQKAALRPPHKSLISLVISGAGDEIRTHDPNLGKVIMSYYS